MGFCNTLQLALVPVTTALTVCNIIANGGINPIDKIPFKINFDTNINDSSLTGGV